MGISSVGYILYLARDTHKWNNMLTGTSFECVFATFQSTEAPRFSTLPTDSTVLNGQSVEFICSAEGTPPATITWTKAGAQISDQRYTVLSSGTLRIVNVAQHDQGQYECHASNRAGANFTVVQLIVLPEDSEVSRTGDSYVEAAIQEAIKNIDDAIDSTKKHLFSIRPKSQNDLLALFRYPRDPDTMEAVRAREIFERTLELIQEKVAKTLNVSCKRTGLIAVKLVWYSCRKHLYSKM
ncbi:Peroxidasin-like [Acipenser ruthenus]|uniref:Peroxidasin-like n=1 Tax=Acipenser ruthenus TaxID=7906 RepID=A0A444UBQ5_ACIRT|nr:Peroxidasin-like [Acipenser ruthenus]